MELREFVKSTLLDIVDGVREAQEENHTGTTIVRNLPDDGNHGKVETITFDISITENKEKTKGRGIEVTAAGIAGGMFRRGRRDESSKVSRVSFSVDLQFGSQRKVNQDNQNHP